MKRTLAPILICLILTPCAALAQQPVKPKVGVSEELGRALEVALAEVESLRNQSKIKDAVIAAKDEQIGALNGLVVIERARAQQWATAALERKEAIVFDDKRIALYDTELLRVRGERDSARAQQKTWGFVGLVLGVTVGIFSQRK